MRFSLLFLFFVIIIVLLTIASHQFLQYLQQFLWKTNQNVLYEWSHHDDQFNQEEIISEQLGPLRDDVTVVTAYFNIGSFAKFSESDVFTPKLYRHWMKVFEFIESPVIGYFDTSKSANYFRHLRRNLSPNLTVVHEVNRNTMWSFRLVPKIARIFAKPNYPRHLPNTVSPVYSAAMHAKYEVMQAAITENPFRTRYFCWLDVGLFRDLDYQMAKNPNFAIYLPPGFSTDSVAYQSVYDNVRHKEASVERIIYDNMVWVCGCFFIAEATVMYRWTQEYRAAVNRLIDDYDLMSTDQQVIYAAFNVMNMSTKIQTYRADGRYNEWFHLGYLAREAGLQRRIAQKIDEEQWHI